MKLERPFDANNLKTINSQVITLWDEEFFEKWKTKEPEFDIRYRELLFDKLTRKGGGSEQSKEDRGKQFANNYELYIYAFFLGLYNNELEPIDNGVQKVSFRYQISLWGSKANRFYRKDFTSLQENMFLHF